uniref:RagB/SusD family nutrient uptake outer membrane protein n=1 Tax=Chitinophaga sp. TaxID=1869181 RepID=UPI0031E05006
MLRRYILLIAITLTGCTKFVEVAEPIDQIPSDVVFDDDTKAASALRGLYSVMIAALYSPFGGSLSVCPGLAADELITTSTLVDFTDFQNNVISTSNGKNNSGLWGNLYTTIYQANAVLKGIENSPNVTPAAKLWIGGEARFCRALYYFYLVNMYGPVPMPLTTDYTTNTYLHRTSIDSVYNLIIADLQNAQANLGDNYTATGNRLRPNKWAATALLARVYLYRQQWQAAIEQSTAVINSGFYALEPLNNVFLNAGRENILQLASAGTNLYTWDAYVFVSLKAHLASSSLLNSFEAGDNRKTSWLTKVTISNTTYYAPYKYKVSTGTGTSRTENTTLLRLGEQYLIRAEAYANAGNISSARSDLDSIRKRAGLPLMTEDITQQALLDTILHERRIELFSELGHRWFDVKRSGKADAIFGAVKTGCLVVSQHGLQLPLQVVADVLPDPVVERPPRV